MITGQVTANREAVIELEIIGPTKQTQRVEAVIDTGFNGYLTLPGNLINRLKLQFVGNRRATLGDGNVVVLDVYLAKVLWHTQEREGAILVIALLGQSQGLPVRACSASGRRPIGWYVIALWKPCDVRCC